MINKLAFSWPCSSTLCFCNNSILITIYPMNQSQPNECQAIAILTNAQELKSLRSQSSKFLKKLAEHPHFLKDMLDIGLRPTYFQKTRGVVLTNDLPALAIDTLVNLYEDFIDLLAFDRILPKDRSLEGLEMDEEEESQMKVEEQPHGEQEFKLLTHIHQCIMENEPEDTAYSYLNRLVGPLCYQRSVELMKFYESHPEIMQGIISRMDHRGVVELFCKILETECGKQFYKDYKVKYISFYFQKVRGAIRGNGSQLQGLQQIYRFMTEKMDERSDHNKYLSLLESISEQELGLLVEINKNIGCINDEGMLLCLRWIEELLKHDNHVMGQTSIRLSITFMNRKDSISNNFYNDELTQYRRNYHISQAQLNEVLYICQYVNSKFLLLEGTQGNIGQILISFYRVMYFFTRIWNYKTKEKQMRNAQLLTLIINTDLLDRTLMAVGKHQNNTSLHNSIKELIIECIRQGIININYFYQPEGMYAQMLSASFPRNRQNAGSTFSQQLYHIYKEVIVTHPHVSNSIEKIILQHTTRMSRLIGGDPRKLHTDSLRGSINAFSESSQNIDEILEFDLSQHSLVLSNNSIQSSKPHGIGVIKVHNPPSIDRSQLQQVGEQRIVIEGVDEQDD